ncbi:PQQ-binding-like beta-propeller repeat protein [Streptomyces sp. Qhu-G9]|uniref:outer membrane protein assembly factor BamB family protein n=1 Tax=Streptomyces sp. Qhu-G9 TaxID=3452799 RepID=UPI0022AC0D3E|nr:PQQ-binding-like beta-propeller repeat protein [Streptomyces aurantiacus]WAU85505.1 PQQ-binding-like beta-propeller repeat protein [Streptomyces aurantiacus]
MTQPPKEPPQGGFGAPQDQPPQGGFGPPQDPPAATPAPPAQPPAAPPPPQGAPQTPPGSGYGYPQQPGPYGQPQQPGPYAPQGPYGQQPGPYTQPGPYGQPQQPGPYGQQPGYGYPTQPQFPGGPGTPPGGGSRSPFKGKPAVIIGAALAAVLVIGGTVWAVAGNGDDDKKKPVADKSQDAKPSGSDAPVNPGDGNGDGNAGTEDLNEGRQAGESKVLWYKEAPDAPGSGADAPGMWITDKVAAKAAYKQLFAYNVGDGEVSWPAITFPQPICAASKQKTSDDKVFVAYKEGTKDAAECNQLVEVDLATGEKGWTKEIPEGDLFDSSLTLSLNIVGDTLMVGRSMSGVGYDTGSGDKLFDKKKYGSACFPSAFTGGSRLLSLASCGAGGDDEHDEVQELDPATGKAKWTKKIPKGWRVERAYSVDPVVLYLTNEDKKQWNVTALKNDGTARSQLDVDESFAPECGWAILSRDLQGCEGVTADANTLYLPTEAKSGANEIVAVSLDTGKEKWRAKSPAAESMVPLKLDGTNLVAYVQPSYDAGGRIVSIPTGGGSHTPKTLLQNPQGAADIENGFFSKAVDFVDGRFFLSTTRLTGNDESKEKLMLAYGK